METCVYACIILHIHTYIWFELHPPSEVKVTCVKGNIYIYVYIYMLHRIIDHNLWSRLCLSIYVCMETYVHAFIDVIHIFPSCFPPSDEFKVTCVEGNVFIFIYI
jgi:membrane-bound metal-dependent hydrolase YbcI (DUF457 family)